MYDGYRMGFIDMGEFAIAKLKDYRRSYVEVSILKHDVKTWLLGEWMSGLTVKAVYKEKARHVFASCASVRAQLSPYPEDEDANGRSIDLTWQSGWDQSALVMFDIIEQLCYSGQFDSRYRDAIKSRLSVADFLDYTSVQEHFDQLKEAIKTEEVGLNNIPIVNNTGGESGGAETQSGDGGATGATGSVLPTTGAEGPPMAFSQLNTDDQEHWEKHIKKIWRTHVRLIPDVGSATQLNAEIRACPLSLLKGDPSGLV
eukprot:6459306-Karenia_brevis.AAC.1